jgi:23S rRNA (uracil1939-C5)-methyltransferase
MVNPKHNDSYSELPWDVWRGTGVLREKLAGYTYDVSPVSFFQTNTQQAEQLYSVVLRYLQQVASDPVDMLYDLYCGAGTITLAASKFGKTVLGLEYNVAAVEDANRNAATYGLDHVYFKAGDIGRILNEELSILYGKPNVVITDPPRGGMDASVCERLLELEPPTIIYVSCNPSTQARDIKLLAAKYKLLEIQPVDMFPQTSHIESAALLTL